jgi:HK97 family phage prohead protease
MKLHPKVKALKQRSAPVTYSTLSVRADGTLTDNKMSVEERTVKGYLIVWGVRDSYGTMFLKGCCAKSLNDRGPLSNSKYKITFLWQHRQDEPIGQFTVLQEDDYGLYFEAVVDDPEEVPTAKRALSQINSGTINQFSAGFDYVWDKMEYDETTDSILLKEIDLYEGSAVTIGANMETYAIRSAQDLSLAKEDLHDETEDFIRSIPRKQQLELRQLIARHISLAKVEPDELRQMTLDNSEPTKRSIDYKYLLNNFSL